MSSLRTIIRLYARVVAAVIDGERDMEVVAEARNWTEAVDQVLRNRPDIAVFDLHMHGMDPGDELPCSARSHPHIIMYSAFSTDEEVYQVFSRVRRGTR